MAENQSTVVTQNDRILRITTPFDEEAPDYLVIQSVELREEISNLPTAECIVLRHEPKEGSEPSLLEVEKILGQPVNIFFATPDGAERVYHGIVNSCTQMDRDNRFTYYRLTVVPSHWLLTQTHNSRIFPPLALPQILEQVLGEYPHELQLGSVEWKPRNYVVQYRESDFNFISRLMEEEGVFYYFKHEEDSHKMIICVDQQSHEKVESKYEIPHINYVKDEELSDVTYIENFIVDYRLQTGKVTMWDYTHQKPQDNFESAEFTRFKFANNQENVEHYLYPSGSIRKYDSIDPSGGEQSSELQNMSDDIRRNTKLFQEAIDARHRTITANGTCPALVAGMRFKQKGNPTAEYNGEYVVTSISHSAVQSPGYFSDMPIGGYKNSFECISWGQGTAPFRPQRITPKPMILSSQTAVVVGPKGEEIYTDKYGRVKVQFKWDREGEFNEASSCWVRVAQSWAGNRWGTMFIPRIGMEVLVHFIEGDPDQPIITGCVYNNDAMPSYELPENKNLSGIKSDSTLGGEGFNEWRFDDKKGEEQVFIHGEKDMDVRIKNDRREWTGKDQHLIVVEDFLEKIGDSQGSHHLEIKDDQRIKIGAERHVKVGSNEAIEIGGTQTIKVTGDQGIKVTGGHSTEATGAMYLKGMNVVVEGMVQLSLKVGGSFVDISPAGVSITGPMVNINSGGAAGTGSAVGPCPPTAPDPPDKAAEAKPGAKMKLQQRSKQRKEQKPAKEDPKKKSWIKIKLVDEEGKPVPGQAYRIKTSDGKFRSGSLNNKGQAHVKGIEPGSCEVTFPNLDKDAWEDA